MENNKDAKKKLKRLINYYNEFIKWSNVSYEEYIENVIYKRALEKQIGLIIDTAINIIEKYLR